MCTVLLRYAPGTAWPVLLGAVRDEFADRPWDPPGRYWPAPADRLVGGRDAQGGGTWLAVDPGPDRPAVAALVNGKPLPPLPPPAGGERPTRGTLALDVLATGYVPDEAELAPYARFHLLLATPTEVRTWTWDGVTLDRRSLPPGDHILVNDGLDTDADPLVPHFRPLLAAAGSAEPKPGPPTAEVWAGWTDLLAGDGLDPADPRALVVRLLVGDRVYGSTSACLVGLAAGAARFDFTADPRRPDAWSEVDLRP